MYRFNTNDIYADIDNTEVAKSALDIINIVPNPYYAYSAYEKDQVDNRVKITNLPHKCTISIYTVDGTLIRKIQRAVNPDTSPGEVTGKVNLETAEEWDLKNSKGISVSSGVYLIHVDAGTLGERVIKWFGVMRPIDLDTF